MLLGVKKYSEKLLLPLGKKIKRIPANVITALGLVFAGLAFLFLYFQILPLIIINLALVEFFDQLDGVVARLQGPTKLGSFLDSTLDRIGDYLIFFGIILGSYTEIYIGLITLAGAFLTSYTRAKIESLGISNLYGVGLLERTDRVPIILIGSILQVWFPLAIWWTMIFLAIGTNITVIQRIVFAFKRFSKKKRR
ncbi:MAG: CDP-alcohol phosphatidyltransferase family protein [Promethearchaeota archaeon]|jgi:CDP-diacylglycerol--glycerol-3-phosphate 3-phosphatidyltransferase/CDP-diacylglycerol--inositol 3-phosphatidyltransferase